MTIKVYKCPDGKIFQVVYKAPGQVDDDGKKRCPEGWYSVRLWEFDTDNWYVSECIKGILGSGDIPVRRNLKIDTQYLESLDDEMMTEYLFVLKGDCSLL